MYKLLGVEVESSTHYRDSRQVFICAAAAAARTTQGPRTPIQGSRSQRQLATRLPARERTPAACARVPGTGRTAGAAAGSTGNNEIYFS